LNHISQVCWYTQRVFTRLHPIGIGRASAAFELAGASARRCRLFRLTVGWGVTGSFTLQFERHPINAQAFARLGLLALFAGRALPSARTLALALPLTLLVALPGALSLLILILLTLLALPLA
jgi:hypothetical protein